MDFQVAARPGRSISATFILGRNGGRNRKEFFISYVDSLCEGTEDLKSTSIPFHLRIQPTSFSFQVSPGAIKLFRIHFPCLQVTYIPI